MNINLSNGGTMKDCVLYVRNVTGIAEEKGFRLYWVDPKTPNLIMPARGLVTSNPFRTAGLAISYGIRQGWGKAKIMRS